ncbi:MAG: PDZ domain-containing protein, partial [Pyrinomonadaceae bacterium]
PKGFDRDVQIPAKDILTLIGVNAEFAGAEWKAGSVVRDSIAERSGIKKGDVIDAVNDQSLTEKTLFGNRFNIKILRVRRDGKSVLISLAH